MPETSGQTVSLCYQVGRAGSMVDIQEVCSEKGTPDSHERLLDNSWSYRLVFHKTNLRMPELPLS